MFDLALAAHIPVIGVTTDDPANFDKVLTFLAGNRKVVELPKKWTSLGPFLYWTDDEDVVTREVYGEFSEVGVQLVVQNPSKSNPLVFDAGMLPTPEPLVKALISDMVPGQNWANLFYPALRGLSLRVVKEVLLLTQARSGGITVAEIRRTRASLFGSTQGLYLEDTSYDFYVWPPKLKEWIDLNKEYFHKATHAKLVPRGCLLDGPPGVGKSMAAKVFANEFGVPLYRFDVASTLDKYIGVSETRVSKILGLIDREAPCVLLLDEVEKIFQSQKEDSGVISRLLSQLLWWLAEHQSRVFVVMTTNDMESIPKELYRPGRIDFTMQIARLGMEDALAFACKVYASVVGKEPSKHDRAILQKALRTSSTPEPATMAHADVAETVYNCIKTQKWA